MIVIRFLDKVVLITGAGKGIGQEVALRFAQEGAIIVANSYGESAKNTVDVLNEQGYKSIFLQGDISNEEDVKNIILKTIEAYGRLDILINNAGVVLPGYLHETTIGNFNYTIDINLKGTFLMSKHAVLQMLKQGGGTIVNNASVAGLKGHTNRLAYAASKGGVIAMTKSMALEYCKKNIRINCVCPGTTLTDSLLGRIENSEDPDKTLKEFNDRQPIGRLGKTSEIAEALLFAADDRVSYMTGSVLVIDGGMTM